MRINPATSGPGVSSLAWTGHLVHVAIPRSRGEYVRWNNFLDVLPHPQGLGPLFTGQWNLYAQNPDSSSHLFGTSQEAGTAILTLLGGFHPQTQSLWLTDIAHHHLAIRSNFAGIDPDRSLKIFGLYPDPMKKMGSLLMDSLRMILIKFMAYQNHSQQVNI